MDLTDQFRSKSRLLGWSTASPSTSQSAAVFTKKSNNMLQDLREAKSKLELFLGAQTAHLPPDSKEEQYKLAESIISQFIGVINKNLAEMELLHQKQLGYMLSSNELDHANKFTILNLMKANSQSLSKGLGRLRNLRRMLQLEKKRFENKFLQQPESRVSGDQQARATSRPDPIEESKPEADNLTKLERDLNSNKQLIVNRSSIEVQRLNETEERLRSVSQVMNVFSEKVLDQGMTTEAILQMSKDSLKDVKEANKEMNTAQHYNESYGKYWSLLFMTLAVLLLVLDYIKK